MWQKGQLIDFELTLVIILVSTNAAYGSITSQQQVESSIDQALEENDIHRSLSTVGENRNGFPQHGDDRVHCSISRHQRSMPGNTGQYFLEDSSGSNDGNMQTTVNLFSTHINNDSPHPQGAHSQYPRDENFGNERAKRTDHFLLEGRDEPMIETRPSSNQSVERSQNSEEK